VILRLRRSDIAFGSDIRLRSSDMFDLLRISNVKEQIFSEGENLNLNFSLFIIHHSLLITFAFAAEWR